MGSTCHLDLSSVWIVENHSVISQGCALPRVGKMHRGTFHGEATAISMP